MSKYQAGQRVVLHEFDNGDEVIPGEHITITQVDEPTNGSVIYMGISSNTGELVEFDDSQVDDTEAIELVPIGDDLGEPGDPLPQRVIDTINQYVERDFWPLCFGEAQGVGFEDFVELCFVKHSNDGEGNTPSSRQMADHFIARGGDD